MKVRTKSLPLILTFVTLVFILLNSCSSNKNKALLIHIIDESASAANDQAFVKEEEQVCHMIADTAEADDLFARIPVNSEQTAVDPTNYSPPEQIHLRCKQKPRPFGKGTFVCPAWELANSMIDHNPGYKAVVITQIQADELEEFCPKNLQDLARKISDNGGQLVIVGSSNEGNTGFNSNIYKFLKSLPNNKVCRGEDGQKCVEDAINSTREIKK